MGSALHAGYDVRTPAPGEFKQMACSTCGADMNVERNVNAATGFAEAMGKGRHLHDRFTCPNAGTDWHNRLIGMMEELKRTVSPTLRRIIESDINAEQLARR